jgi:ribosome-associated protein
METFKLTQDYIHLNQLLKLLHWCNDGGHANYLIDDGQVKVNGQTELRRRNKIVDGMMVELGDKKVKVVS